MATDYDELGADYLLTKGLPWKRFSERYTFFKAVGPVRGLRLIDVACGDGYYSRQFRDAGADVVGVDVSSEMIRLAQEREHTAPRGIRHEVGDATDLEGFVARTGLGGFGGTVSAENTMWTPPTITAELEAAGFVDVQWPPAEIGPEGTAAMGEAYWADFLGHPYHAVTSATRRR